MNHYNNDHHSSQYVEDELPLPSFQEVFGWALNGSHQNMLDKKKMIDGRNDKFNGKRNREDFNGSKFEETTG